MKTPTTTGLYFNKKRNLIFYAVLIIHLSSTLYSHCQPTEENKLIKNSESNSPQIIPSELSIKANFFFGGNFDKTYISIGLSKRSGKRFLPSLSFIYYDYSYHVSFFSYTVGLNNTNLLALSLYYPYNYCRLFNHRIKLFIGPDLNLSYSSVKFTNTYNQINLNPIIAPIIFISHEITGEIGKNIWLLLNTSIGYGNGFYDKNDNRYNYYDITDRIGGYGEIRVNYGFRYFFK